MLEPTEGTHESVKPPPGIHSASDQRILTGIGLLTAMSGLTLYGIEQFHHFEALRIRGLPASILGLIVFELARRDKSSHAVMLICWGALLVIFSDAMQGAGIYTVTWTFFPLVTIIACWWLSPRMTITIGIAAMVEVVIVYFLQVDGRFIEKTTVVPSTIATRLITTFFGAQLIGLTIARHVQRYVADLRESRQELINLNANLEKKVAERTSHLEFKTKELEAANKLLDNHRNNLEQLVAERTLTAEQARMVAESSNRAKSVFLKNMSHEFRTPLHAVLSFGQLGKKRTDAIERIESHETKRLNDYFSRVVDSGLRLKNLLDDILAITDLQTTTLSLAGQKLPFAAVLQTTANRWRNKSPGSCAIELDMSAAPMDVLCEPQKLGEVFERLFDNAARYAPGSPILVQTERIADANNPAKEWVRCHVIDGGKGIPQTEQERVFEAFTESETTASDAGGRGLGLTICRAIVALHGGKIYADRAEGGGCKIVLLLPLSS